MKASIKLFGTFFLGTALLIGCANKDNEGNEELTTDIIQNPQTASELTDTTVMPLFEFEQLVHEFGTITQGEKVEHTFNFKNTGKTALVISSVQASCGCTVADDWPKTPVMPGKDSSIKVTFNSEGKKGQIYKTVSIIANTHPSTTILALKGEIIAPEN